MTLDVQKELAGDKKVETAFLTQKPKTKKVSEQNRVYDPTSEVDHTNANTPSKKNSVVQPPKKKKKKVADSSRVGATTDHTAEKYYSASTEMALLKYSASDLFYLMMLQYACKSEVICLSHRQISILLQVKQDTARKIMKSLEQKEIITKQSEFDPTTKKPAIYKSNLNLSIGIGFKVYHEEMLKLAQKKAKAKDSK